jgi:hypothetical protein
MPCRSQDPKFVYYLSGEANTSLAHSMSVGSWHRSRLPVLAVPSLRGLGKHAAWLAVESLVTECSHSRARVCTWGCPLVPLQRLCLA